MSGSMEYLVKNLLTQVTGTSDIIITDEAHHAAAKSYRKIYNYFNYRLNIGFTATPNRGDNARLDNVFQKIVFEKDIRFGIQNHYLTDINCLRANIGFDLRKVKRKKDDFDLTLLSAAINKKAMNEGVAKAYYELAKGQTIIFAVDVAHAYAIAEEIEGAVVVSAETKNRDEIIQKFTNREIPVLVNCMVFTEGTDIPLIETVLIARPTRNASLYTQMVGRGLRPYPGKECLTLIDCVGVTEDNDICTAPSLLGISLRDVPKKKRSLAIGMLMDMGDTVKSLIDTSPESWIVNTKMVNLFISKNGYDSHKIKWFTDFEGSYICNVKGVQVKLLAPDHLGMTKLCYKPGADKPFYRNKDLIPMQEGFDKAYELLRTYHKDEERIWDMDKVSYWGDRPASTKQIQYINALKKKPENKKYDFSDINLNTLTKYEAGIIIERLKG